MTAAVRNLLAYSSDGRVMAIAHERDVLVYSGTDESPLWRCECDADIIAVGANHQFVFALDQSGRVNRWNATTGESRQTVTISSPVLGMAVAENGDCAITSNDGIMLVRNATVIQSLKLPSITAVGWSVDGRLLACAERTGRLGIYQNDTEHDALATEPLARTYVKEPVLSIAPSKDGSWLVASGNAVWQLDPQRAMSNAIMSNTQQPPRLVAISQNGRLMAFTMGDRDIVAMHLNPTSFAGTITYQDRVVTGLAFGPDLRLAIGLDTGDGNIIDFSQPQGGVSRTDPHPGRPHHQWLLNVSILPRLSGSVSGPAGASSTSQGNAIPAWLGPIIGPAIGLVIGLKISAEGKPEAAPMTVITAVLLGFAGGGLMWLIDLLRKK